MLEYFYLSVTEYATGLSIFILSHNEKLKT